MTATEYFIELYGGLPRGGPGDDASTGKAFEMMSSLPPRPRILDLGCGPGMQTLALLRLSDATVTALDVLPQMISRVRRAAERAGLSERLETVQADMNDMSFESASFDVVWSEGAIYNLGFEAGLARVLELVRPGGYVAVTEPVWLEPQPPPEAVEFWKAYPAIAPVADKLEIVDRLGYRSVGHFVLPASSWTDTYYGPMRDRISSLARDWEGIPAAAAVIAEANHEIAVFESSRGSYGYAFFVMRR